MIVSDELKKDYPKLCIWLTTNIPKTIEKPKVFAAFMKYSEQNEARAKTALKSGAKPNVSFRVMPDANGEFEGDKFPDTVFVAKAICDKFETSPADAKDARMHELIESTVLHEMVHWGDWQDGKDQPEEEGKEFEKEAYGKDVDRYW